MKCDIRGQADVQPVLDAAGHYIPHGDSLLLSCDVICRVDGKPTPVFYADEEAGEAERVLMGDDGHPLLDEAGNVCTELVRGRVELLVP